MLTIVRNDVAGRAGSCPVCNTTLAAAYPSLGGADCPVTCAAGTSSFTTIYHVGEYHGAGASQFRNSMLRAGESFSCVALLLEEEEDREDASGGSPPNVWRGIGAPSSMFPLSRSQSTLWWD